MDVMMPKLFWIKGAYFRNPNENHSTNQDEDPDDFVTGEDNDMESEEMIDSVPVEEHGGKFRAQLDIPSELFGFLIGRKAANLNMVQDNTGCKVNIPRRQDIQSGPVEVVGGQRRGVVRACNMLTMTAERGRRALKPSHFVAVRLATQHVQNRLETFKVAALAAGGGARGVVPALFQDGSRLHLTLSMLTLLNSAERRRACCALTDHANQLRALLPRSGLSLRVRGLDIMNDDRGDTRVLFARVRESDDSGAMQKLADQCLKIMSATGMAGAEKVQDSVKLHCTLMNVSFLVREIDEADPQHRILLNSTFDATHIMEELGQFDFGTVAVDALEVVQRQAFDDAGFYLPIGKLSLKAE